MMNLDALRERRSDLLNQAQAILDSEAATPDDIKNAESLVAQAESVGEQITTAAALSAKLHEARNTPDNPQIRRITSMGGLMFEGGELPGARPVFRDNGTGRDVQALVKGDLLAKRSTPGMFGERIANVLRGDIQNANFGTSDASGGYLLSPEYSGLVVDLARSASVCMRAGGLTLPMNTSEMTVTTVTGDATPVWRAETQAITASSMTFGRINLKAKVLAVLVPISIELLEDSANAGPVIEQAIAAALGQKLDLAGLYGSGAGAEPLGIKYASGTNSVTSVGTPTAGASTWAKPLTGIKNILDANFPGQTSELAWIQNPRDFTNWNGLSDSTYQPLQAPKIIADMQNFTTTALPKTEGGGAESSAIIGHFPSLLFGMRTSGVVMQILDSGSAVDDAGETWNATSQMMRFIRVYLRADVALLRPSWFSVLSGITSA